MFLAVSGWLACYRQCRSCFDTVVWTTQGSGFSNLSLSVCLSFSVLTAVFPGEPEFLAKDDESGGDNWSYKSCRALVKSSPPTNQHPTFYRPDTLPVAQRTVSSTEGKLACKIITANNLQEFPGGPGITRNKYRTLARNTVTAIYSSLRRRVKRKVFSLLWPCSYWLESCSVHGMKSSELCCWALRCQL